MKSLWMDTVQKPSFEPLKQDMHTEVLIIGGGLAGLMCAYMLRRSGVDCALVEQGRICEGISGNTTAKITAQHGLIYDQMIRSHGLEKARMYLQANLAALDALRSICTKMNCDFEERDSYVYVLRDRGRLERELRALDRMGFSAQLAEDLPLPIPTAGAVRFQQQAQFHPLKFAYGIAKDLPIYEHTKILELFPGGARTQRARICADRTIVATHFPFINKHGGYFVKLYQHRSYVLALENAQDVKGMYVDADDQGLSFRNYGDTLLLGGGGHRTGKQSAGWRELDEFAMLHYPEAHVAARWATQDCMTLDGIPYIGQYSKATPRLYVATGFNKWGMSSSMVSAMILRDMILGRKNPWSDAFTPSRSILRPQLAINAAESVLHLLTPTAPRCPHMGCALKYNAQEHSWDCPCHGSRFDTDGKLIDNPATGDRRKK